jgi:hypothetical protein
MSISNLTPKTISKFVQLRNWNLKTRRATFGHISAGMGDQDCSQETWSGLYRGPLPQNLEQQHAAPKRIAPKKIKGRMKMNLGSRRRRVEILKISHFLISKIENPRY